ncbi:reverse transcriptase domain-containing protein [Tanacetum coccineum]
MAPHHGCRKSISGNETVHRWTPNANRTKTKRRADHVPLCGQRSNQCYFVNRKGLTVNANLFCLSCTTSSGNQLQLNGKLVLALNAERMARWTFELGAFDINYRPRTSIHGQILADFIAERPDEDAPPTGIPAEFEFVASNNEAEYEALVAGLWIAEQMDVKNLATKVDSCLVANEINGSYIAKEQSMIQYLEKAKALIIGFKKFSIEQVPRSENKKADALSKIASTSFAHLTKQVLVEVFKEKSIEEKAILTIVEEEGYSWMTQLLEYLTDGTLLAETKKAHAINIKSRQYAVIGGVLYRPFPEAHGKVKFLIIAIDYFTKWIEAKSVATITENQIKKFVSDNIVCRLSLSGEIMSDNEKQFRDNTFKDWCDKLNIKQRFASVKHPQTNGLVERENRSLKEGIKPRHSILPHLIPVEIGMPSLRCVEVDQVLNDEALLLNLDMLDEKRDRAAIREAKTSHAKEGGKLVPKWEGLYKVVEALGKGAYKIRNGNGDILPRTWNVQDLKKCYL